MIEEIKELEYPFVCEWVDEEDYEWHKDWEYYKAIKDYDDYWNLIDNQATVIYWDWIAYQDINPYDKSCQWVLRWKDIQWFINYCKEQWIKISSILYIPDIISDLIDVSDKFIL